MLRYRELLCVFSPLRNDNSLSLPSYASGTSIGPNKSIPGTITKGPSQWWRRRARSGRRRFSGRGPHGRSESDKLHRALYRLPGLGKLRRLPRSSALVLANGAHCGSLGRKTGLRYGSHRQDFEEPRTVGQCVAPDIRHHDVHEPILFGVNSVDLRHWNTCMRGNISHGLRLGWIAWSLDDAVPAHSSSQGAEGTKEQVSTPKSQM